jgi:biotin carboxyl carrier protein
MTKKKVETKKTTDPMKDEDVSKIRYSSLMLQVQGAKYKTLLTEKYKNRKKWVKPDINQMFSDIPGTVVKIYVEEGQKVKEGELMMVLEAMKMKNKIYFPVDGTVKKIYVKEEQRVPKGFLMIELK